MSVLCPQGPLYSKSYYAEPAAHNTGGKHDHEIIFKFAAPWG